MVVAESRQFWEVIGGGEKAGIVVRQGQDLSSPLLPERLQTGSLVVERALAGERLHFDRLTGAGPASGWVSLRLTSGKEMLTKAIGIWEVVGGADRGGIVVRKGKDVSSELAPARLSTGALVRELVYQDERLHYQRLTGTGPETGWVSSKLKDSDKVLLVLVGAGQPNKVEPSVAHEPVPAASAAVPARRVEGQKVRVLAVHGTPGNSNVMKFLTSQLRKLMGADAEWLFVDAPTPWQPQPGSPWPNDAERSDFEKRLADKKPFLQWYHIARHGEGGFGDQWECVDDCTKHLWDYLTKQAPVDVVVAFSQGSSMVSILLEVMRRLGHPPPWKLNVFFNGGNIDDKRYQFEVQSSLPTIYVGGNPDPFGEYVLEAVKRMYADLTLMDHGDGHSFPFTQPRASEVYEQVALLIRGICGLEAKPAAPQRRAPPSPSAVTEAGLPAGRWTADYLGQARGACKACGSCEWYRWHPSALPEEHDLEGASVAKLYSCLRCQACRCDFLDHRSLGLVDKPAGFHLGLSEAGEEDLAC